MAPILFFYIYIINMIPSAEILLKGGDIMTSDNFVIDKYSSDYKPKIFSEISTLNMVDLVKPPPSPIIPTQIKS